MFIAVCEIPAIFMLSKEDPHAESYGCVTVKRERYSWVKDEEMIHENIKIFATN